MIYSLKIVKKYAKIAKNRGQNMKILIFMEYRLLDGLYVHTWVAKVDTLL